MSFAGESNAMTWPPASTRILSELSTKRRRCAIASTVASLLCVERISNSRSADSLSSEAVHSSRTKIFGRRTSALAAIRSCCWPTERPPGLSSVARASATGPSSLPAICRASKPHHCSAVSTSASVNSTPMLSFRVMAKSVGSCGTTAILLRKPASLRVATSTPSTRMRPPLLGATPFSGPKRNKRLRRVDLPLPVFPTTPTFSAGCTTRLTSFHAGGK
mmetsp:Transcript_27719/g.76323  ORF Transcript_27719/g.76323 Transcript_27719/m.76323 type:complete len:219 (+) Transcript_27719:387-1043(+)